ncbi:MAG: hypothetical protein H0X66_02960 [Verrucomicrobia bacterium]|nr:hypothetical protein [Verrucomicrobiota bacterium]
MRMVSFREGVIDHALLTSLAKRNPERADEITRRIARTITDFERQSEPYHQVRMEILAVLEE